MMMGRSLLALALTTVVAGLGCDHVVSLKTSPEASVPTGWTLIPAGTTNFNAVSGVSDDAVWVVGDHGTIQHWEGKSLTLEPSGTTVTLRGVFALDTDQAFAVGDAGTILQRMNGTWSQVGMGVTRQVLTGVWADTARVVAVGSGGTVILGMGGNFQVIPNPLQENIFSVTGTAGGTVTAVGALGLLLQLNGNSLSRTPIPAFSKVLSGATIGPTAAFYVGQNGTVYRNDATGLNAIPGCPPAALRAVASVDNDAWAVGWDGSICKISGTTSTGIVYPYTSARWFNGIYAASSSSLWVVGSSGTLLHGLPENPADGGGAP